MYALVSDTFQHIALFNILSKLQQIGLFNVLIRCLQCRM